MTIAAIGIDIGKSKCHVCALNERVLFRFLANTSARRVATGACAGTHFVGRKAEALGHDARPLPAQYVKAYVKSHKNDFPDAGAIVEAAILPTMRSVPVKPADR